MNFSKWLRECKVGATNTKQHLVNPNIKLSDVSKVKDKYSRNMTAACYHAKTNKVFSVGTELIKTGSGDLYVVTIAECIGYKN